MSMTHRFLQVRDAVRKRMGKPKELGTSAASLTTTTKPAPEAGMTSLS
jgi:hypothetical protein